MSSIPLRACSALASLTISVSALANPPTRAVALSGDPIPEHDPFKTFRGNAAIAINNNGQVLFEGRDESDGAIWLGNPDGTRTLLHHIFDPAPGFPPGYQLNQAERSLIHWYLNDSGQTLISSGIFNYSAPNSGLEKIVWLAGVGSLVPVARESQPPPEVSGDVTRIMGLHLNETGGIVALYITNASTDTGTLTAGLPGSLEIVAQNVAQNPQPMIDNAGEVAFLGSRAGTNGIWFGPPSNMKLLASGASLSGPYVSKNGHLAYGANGTLYAAAPLSPPIAILHNNDPAPGRPGATIDGIRGMQITDSGYVAFEASANGKGGYWVGLPGSIHPVALEGDPVPDVPGMIFSSLTNELIFINNSGELLFPGHYLNPLTSATERGLWVFDNNGIVHLIARQNGQLEFDGQMRTVSDVGIRYGLNDFGQIAFTATFTDGSSGVFLATIPEPTALFLLMPIVLVGRRRRRLSSGT
jgi:hypothetical protein